MTRSQPLLFSAFCFFQFAYLSHVRSPPPQEPTKLKTNAATGPDAALLRPDQLVYCDCTVRGRDDADVIFLSGLSAGKNEGGEGKYDAEKLCDIARLLVPFGGLQDVGLKAGETVVVAPATGPFGGAAVHRRRLRIFSHESWDMFTMSQWPDGRHGWYGI